MTSNLLDLPSLLRLQNLQLQARINALDGSVGTFEAWNPLAAYPQADPDGSVLDDSDVAIKSVGANGKSLALKGLPAAYVSGFLRTLPPPGMPRLEGADATHAWVSVWCGPDAGWVDFDPTNAIVANESHIVIGVGRDYADVAPETGVIVTSGRQALDVAVDVTPLA